MNDGFSHPITARDVCVGKGVVEDHTHVAEFRAFNDMNRLKMCKHKEEHEILGLTLSSATIKETRLSKNAAAENCGTAQSCMCTLPAFCGSVRHSCESIGCKASYCPQPSGHTLQCGACTGGFRGCCSQCCLNRYNWPRP